MRYFPRLFYTVCLFVVINSCRGKDKSAQGPGPEKDTTKAGTVQANAADSAAVENALLFSAKSIIAQDLGKWSQSFQGFNIDSFRFYQRTGFADIDYGSEPDANFYDLYKASLAYAPDSSQFVDLYSYGLTLEKKGKKVVAVSDVDNGVTLYDRESKTWKRILFFGPSSWIEEAIWISPSRFLLAGVGPGESEYPEAFILIGDTKEKSLRWFESKATRPQSMNYEASGMKKLKIDEWE